MKYQNAPLLSCLAFNAARAGNHHHPRIENDFLRPETLAIFMHDIGYSNMQAEHYLAYMHAAFALEYWPLAGEAIYGDHDFMKWLSTPLAKTASATKRAHVIGQHYRRCCNLRAFSMRAA